MQHTILILSLLLFSSTFINAQDQKAYDIRLRASVHPGITELRFSPPTVEIQNPNETPGPVFLQREIGRSFKGQLSFSIVWKRKKDRSLKETWGISMGYAYNRQEYLQYLPGDDFLRLTTIRDFHFLSIPIQVSRNFFWGSNNNRLELSLGPEISLISGGSSGYRIFISDGYLQNRSRRPDGIRLDLAFMALWKGQLLRKQDIGFGFGLNYGLQSVLDQNFLVYRLEDPNTPPQLTPENLRYRVESKVLPINYFLVLQYDLSLSRRN